MSQKLKSIYDALDHGNYKSCLKLCAAFLQKQPGHALCKALHAVALERCGRKDEALRCCEEARTAPTGVDDTVLSTLQVVYRRCRQLPAITQMYEAAVAGEPDSEEYATILFTSAARDGDFVRAQQVATKLYAKHKKQKFLHWTIAALLLQARTGGSPKALDLAGAMLQKAPINMEALAGGGSVPFNRGQLYLLLLHLDALRLQGKSAAALEVLEACRELVKLPSDLSLLRTQLRSGAGQVVEAAKEARARLLQNVEDWGAAQAYVQLAFQCPAPVPLPTRQGAEGPVPDHSARLRPPAGGQFPKVEELEAIDRHATEDEVWNASLLFRHLQLQAEKELQADDDGAVPARRRPSAAASRAARLAALELHRLAFCANEASDRASSSTAGDLGACASESDVAAFSAAIKEFVRLFAHKGHCFFDLKPYICLLGDAAAGEVAAAASSPDPPVAPQRRRDCALTAARLRRALAGRGGAGPAEQMVALEDSARLLLAESTGEEEEEAQDGMTGSCVADGLLTLLVVTLLDMDRICCRSTPEEGRGYLLLALALAELGLSRFPHAFHFKVLLLLLHAALGLPAAVLGRYHTMDIKNVQHESLSYLALDACCLFGCQESIRELCRSIAHFHEDLDRDGHEALAAAFQTGVLHRVHEYYEALRLAGASIVWGRAVVEDALCEVGQAQTWEAAVEPLTRQVCLLSAVAGRSPDSWVLRNQDRCLLNGLHPIPRCTPLGAARHSAQAWRAGAPSPTVTLLGAPLPVASAFGAIWGDGPGPPATEASSGVEAAAAAAAARSAAEELLDRGLREQTPQRLRLAACLLRAVAAVVRAEGPDEDALAATLVDARAAASVEAGAGVDAGAELAAPFGAWATWSDSGHAFSRAAMGCALLLCEFAAAALQGCGGKEAWDAAERHVSAAGGAAQRLVDAVLGRKPEGAAPEEGEDAARKQPFALGRHGVLFLWALLHNCLTVVLPLAMWGTTALPKAGSGKKAKEGQETLHATRVGLRNLLATLQAGLTDIHAKLTSAQADDHAAALWPQGPTAAFAKFPALRDVAGLEARCEQVQAASADWHRKHLQALQEAVSCRLALLKSRPAFKP